MVAAHLQIVALVQDADRRDPAAGHVALDAGNLLAMFAVCDALIGDVSSVPLDFLYLRPDAPILLTDRRTDRTALIANAPLAVAVPVVDARTVADVGALVAEALTRDAQHAARLRVRADYFGDLAPGDSTRAFTAAVSDLVRERDSLLDESGVLPPQVPGEPLATAAGDLGLVS
jgi:CDP-glycerol glycerophosphotransferase (TagB/SpsB family)